MTQTQVKSLPAPLGGLRLDLPSNELSDQDMSDCQNVQLIDGIIKSRNGYKLLGSNLPLSGAIMGSDQFYLWTGTSYLLATTTLDVYNYLSADDKWVYITEHIQNDDCEVNWTASLDVTTALDAINYKEGANSVKITPAAVFTTGLLAYHDITSVDISVYNHMRLWVKSSIALAAGDIQFLIDDTAACASPLKTLDIPALTAGEWKEVFLDLGDASGLTAVISLGLNAAADFGACDINIDDIRAFKTFTGNDDDFFSCDYILEQTAINPWWIITNFKDNIKKWTGTGNLADLGGSPPKAKIVCEFKGYLVIAYTVEGGNTYPQRVRWSDRGSPENWSTGNANYATLTGADYIQKMVAFKGDYLVVIKERSTWIGAVSGSSTVFDFNKRADVGTSAPNTVETIGDEIIFLGWDDIYAFNGINYQAIGISIAKELFDKTSPSEMHRSFAIVIEENNEYWLFVPRVGEIYPSVVWCYNYLYGKWTWYLFNDFITMYGYYFREENMIIGDLEGTIGEQDYDIGSRTIMSNAPTNLFGSSDGYIYEYNNTEHNDNGVAIDSWFETKDYNFTNLIRRQRILRLDVYYNAVSLRVHYSTDRGNTWSYLTELGENTNFDAPRRIFMRKDCEMIRFRFSNNNAGEWFEYRNALLYFQEAGRLMQA
jgi:hypothetical protein